MGFRVWRVERWEMWSVLPPVILVAIEKRENLIFPREMKVVSRKVSKISRSFSLFTHLSVSHYCSFPPGVFTSFRKNWGYLRFFGFPIFLISSLSLKLFQHRICELVKTFVMIWIKLMRLKFTFFNRLQLKI